MARRKLSTFERLQRGERLNRKERREVQQRLNLDDPGLDIIGTPPALTWATRATSFRYLLTGTRSPFANLVRGPGR